MQFARHDLCGAGDGVPSTDRPGSSSATDRIIGEAATLVDLPPVENGHLVAKIGHHRKQPTAHRITPSCPAPVPQAFTPPDSFRPGFSLLA